MAKFNPDQGPLSADYTSDSKGFKANTAGADLFGDTAQLGIAGVKIADQNNLSNIQTEVQNEVDQVNNEWGTKASAFETNISNAGNQQPLPSDLENYGKQLRDTRKAYLNGNLKDSNYQMRIDSMSRQIRARYPGYREEIDKIIGSTLQLSTANDLRKSLMSQWTSEAATADAEAKRYDTFINQAREKGALQSDWDIRNNNGNPYTEAETKAHVAAVYSVDANYDRQLKALNVQDKSSEAGKKAALDLAQTDVSNITRKFTEGAYTLSGGGTMSALFEKIKAGQTATMSSEDKAQLTMGFSQAYTKMQTDLNARMNLPQYDGLSGDQKAKLVEQGLSVLNVAKDQIFGQQYGLLSISETLNKTQLADDLKMLGSDPAMRVFTMLKAWSNGSAVLDSLALGNPEMTSALNKALLNFTTGSFFDKSKGSLKAVIDGVNQASGNKLAPEVIKQSLKNAVTMLLDKNAGLDVATQAATLLFSEENQAFLNDYTTKSQRDLYDTFTSERVRNRMIELDKSVPGLLKNYTNWTLNSFHAMFNQDIATINDVNKFGNNITIQWNGKAGEFQANPNTEGLKRNVNALDQIYNAWSDDAAKTSMDALNKYIKGIKPIIEANGGTVEDAMTAIFEKEGINKTKNQGSLFYRMYEAMSKGNIDPKTGKPYQGPGGKGPTKASYEAAINTPSAELNGIDLDKTGSGALSSGSKLKDTIRRAEGTAGSYNTRFGGASDIELSNYDVGDVQQMAQIFGKKTGSSAIGAYQFMPDTIDELIKEGVIKPDDMFTPALQEKMADYLIAKAKNGSKTMAEFAKNLAGRWASLPQGPDETSQYTGVGMNTGPKIKWDDLMEAFGG